MPHLLALLIIESIGQVYGVVEEGRLCCRGRDDGNLVDMSTQPFHFFLG